MCTTKNDDKNKTNLSSPPFDSSYNFFNCRKTTKTLKFSGYQFVLYTFLLKFKRNCMSGLFCIRNLLKVDRGFLWILTHSKPK